MMEDSPLATAEGLRNRPLWDVPPADIIDHKLLQNLTQGDQALSRELLALFFDHSALALRTLRDAADQAGRRAAAHALQGSALAVAAKGVALSAALIVGLPENVAEGEWLDAVTDLHAQVAQTRAAIAHLLDGDTA
jgi:HPt (histidine-containing phosphotransfer) domain-containing protein